MPCGRSESTTSIFRTLRRASGKRFPKRGRNVADCCDDKVCALDQLRERQSATLKAVLVINAAMFLVVLAAGLYAGSSAVLADSLDNLGDALTYALSLYAVGRGGRTKGWVAMFKAMLILAAALFVMGQIGYRLFHPGVPLFEAMGMIGVAALGANAACLGLLWKHRNEDVNMSSVWECSRNDIASNVAVLIAAALVAATSSGWPDVIIGALLVLVFLRSAVRVFRGAAASIRKADELAVR
jgi:Co/Zn/Cd efflux system component